MKPSFNEIVPQFNSLNEIGVHKGLAKFGDVVTNMAYSIAITIITGKLDASKVSKKILANALKQSNMKKYAVSRANAHDMANTAEAFIGYMYCIERWGVEKMAKILIKILERYDFLDYKQEIDGSIMAFKALLQIIEKKLILKFENPSHSEEIE